MCPVRVMAAFSVTSLFLLQVSLSLALTVSHLLYLVLLSTTCDLIKQHQNRFTRFRTSRHFCWFLQVNCLSVPHSLYACFHFRLVIFSLLTTYEISLTNNLHHHFSLFLETLLSHKCQRFVIFQPLIKLDVCHSVTRCYNSATLQVNQTNT